MLRDFYAELLKALSAEQNMGVPIQQTRRWSVDTVSALANAGIRYEVVDGELLVTRRQASCI